MVLFNFIKQILVKLERVPHILVLSMYPLYQFLDKLNVKKCKNISSKMFLVIVTKFQDPDGGKIQYKVISGHLPPGTSLNSTTGVISGTAPDIDASYTFGIRATDQHGKYADGTFSIDIRGYIILSVSNCITFT